MTAALAEAALGPWGGAAAPPRLVVDRENAVYEVRLCSGERAALRLHRAGYRSPAAIEAEMAWTAALAEDGFPCPRPVAAEDGALLARAPDGRAASVVTWIDAPPLAEGGPTVDAFRRLGGLIARLHDETDRLGPETHALPSWTGESLLGDHPVWGRFWEHPHLTPEESRLLQIVREEARARLDALPEPDLGPIHGDVLLDNVLDQGSRLWLIDFDDCGVGHRVYDLGTALVGHAERPDYPDLAAALVAGYASRRGNGARVAAELSLFVMLRALASCGWVLSRTETGDPRRRAYADRAVRLAERWLARAGA
ncbi:MAG: putative homoserine kinase type II (protein kinase fold) [Rhodobacteraceae bacterium HLUCCA09]|nr:MAG: putative homoserine kinase type II (protein kinase fold) [Rhodobacteraceae bacterium HLUCCA09]